MILEFSRLKFAFSRQRPEPGKGSGYVVKTLEAALWAFFNSSSFKEGCLMVSNLGGDADTTAAVYGMLAGAFYGLEGIPKEWRDKIALQDFISPLCEELIRLGNNDQLKPSVVSPGNHSHLSESFKNVLQCFEKLEEGFRPIRDKLLPGPKQYKSLAALDADAAAFRIEYSKESPSCPQREALLQDVDERLVARGRTKLAAVLAKPRIVLPFRKD